MKVVIQVPCLNEESTLASVLESLPTHIDVVEYALSIGADIVVNTDGDNQYPGDRIGDLVAPIVAGEADIVMGDRQTHTIEHFSPFKKTMQRFGSWVVNRAAGTKLPGAAIGVRCAVSVGLLLPMA